MKTRKIILALSVAAMFSLNGCAPDNFEKEPIASIIDGYEVNRIENASTVEVITEGEAKDLAIAKSDAEEIYLNVDINNIVESLTLSTLANHAETVVTWTSNNIKVLGHQGNLKDTRDKTVAHSVTLTATVKYRTATVAKKFNLTVPAVVERAPFSENTIVDNFSEYVTGREMSHYYDWNMTSGNNSEGNGISEIIEEVPNNNMISQKAVQFPSYRLSTDVQYDRFLSEKEAFALETYVMFTEEINGLYFEFFNNSTRGVSAGITSDGFSYYTSGSHKTATNAILDEGVWTKIRIDVDLASGTYDYSYYDWYSNELKVIAQDVAMANKINEVTKFRVRVPSGLKNGCSYMSDLVIKPSIEKNIGTNPNRTIGIGKVTGISTSEILLEKGDQLPEPTIEVFNRFNRDTKLTLNDDYTISVDGIENTNNTGEFQRNFTIKLKETGEEKVLTQNIYVDEKDGASNIRTFVSSSILNSAVTLTGKISKTNSAVYYMLVEAGSKVPSASDIKAGKDYQDVKVAAAGSLSNCQGAFTIRVSGLSEAKEYDIYVVTEHDGILSDYKVKNAISTVINIETCDDFYNMTINPETKSKQFRLMNDLDFSNYEWFVNPADTLKFLGQLDGQGYTIKNLTINNEFDGSLIKKYGIFYELGNSSNTAVIENLSFENCNITTYEDTGLIAGYSYNSLVQNISIDNLSVKAANGATGEGYLAAIFGRVDDGETTINNVAVNNAYIETYKYGGCIVANSQDTNLLRVTNVLFIGEMNNEGAYAGIVGRNRAPLYVENVYIELTIKRAKKQVGLICGQTICSGAYNGNVTANNVFGRLIVNEMDQPTYMNQGIGDYSASDKPEEDYSITNFLVSGEDYSDLSDDLIPILNSVNGSKYLNLPEVTTKQWWIDNTWYTNLDSDEFWYFDEALNRPNLIVAK